MRPPIAWKKSSSGVNPLMKELSTKPRARGVSSNCLKWGSVRFVYPYGIRLPSTFCWPKQEIICEMFRLFPLDPLVTRATNRLFSSRDLIPKLPASLDALFKILLTCVSKNSTFVLPVLFSRIPRCTWSMRLDTSSFFFEIISSISVFVFSLAIKSLIPTLNPVVFMYSVIMFCRLSIKCWHCVTL